ncbi:hypothetical protein OAO01_05460 [Oligoflexia bacterium]|nr:hypothetical protein [Oligoflexia bacterium]
MLGGEVDIVLETQKGFLAIELKSSDRWDRRYNKGLKAFHSELAEDSLRCLGVYLGKSRSISDGIEVFPVLDFLRALWNEEIII